MILITGDCGGALSIFGLTGTMARLFFDQLRNGPFMIIKVAVCLLYTSDAADD